MESLEQELFPHPSFRENQHPTLKACINAFDDGYKNVVLDAPTGTGKSPIITALLRYANNGFYTTPQKSLRQQIQEDEALEPYVEDLKARQDYYCPVGNDNCKDCKVNKDPEQSCSKQADCTYWNRKHSVMASDIGVITFSMLIVDGLLPTYVDSGGEEMQISFDDRDMVAVDEAHGLVEQTREMHAGFDLSDSSMPDAVSISDVLQRIPESAEKFEEVQSEMAIIRNRCKDFYRDTRPADMSDEQVKCKQISRKIKRASDEVDNGKAWVIDVDRKKYYGNYYKTIELRPIDVSGFLRNFVWNRGNKRILSTATLPNRGNPDIWIRKVGLDPKETKVINVSMTFPPENRPIITDEMVASMSSGGCKKNWDSVLEKLNEIVSRFPEEKGICHTASYNRAQKVEDTITEEDYPYLKENVYVHSRDEDAEVAIEQWLDSDLNMILSPSMMEGIDLNDWRGRYNILMKVPYPRTNSTVNYLLNETKYGWNEYYNRAAIRIAQAYGRTNRSKDDWSNFYILDEDYDKVKKRATFPRWLLEAEEYPEVGTKGVFDY